MTAFKKSGYASARGRFYGIGAKRPYVLSKKPVIRGKRLTKMHPEKLEQILKLNPHRRFQSSYGVSAYTPFVPKTRTKQA